MFHLFQLHHRNINERNGGMFRAMCEKTWQIFSQRQQGQCNSSVVNPKPKSIYFASYILIILHGVAIIIPKRFVIGPLLGPSHSVCYREKPTELLTNCSIWTIITLCRKESLEPCVFAAVSILGVVKSPNLFWLDHPVNNSKGTQCRQYINDDTIYIYIWRYMI